MRPLRSSDPTIIRLLTIRTVSGKLLMTPNRKVRRLIGGIVARYQELLEIELFACTVLSNHYHMIVRGPRGNVDEFMENVNREIARRMNFYLRREGKFWGRRYDDQEILSEEDLLEAFLYVITNATRHGLVAETREWTGLHCFEQVLSEKNREFSFVHYSAEREQDRVSTHTLKLSILPMLRGLSRKVRRKKLQALLEQRMQEIREGRYKDGGGFVGMEVIQDQDPESVPLNSSRTPRPPCYTKCPKRRKEYRRCETERRARYREASFRFRLGDLTVQFPQYTFPPPLHRKPRKVPFCPLDSDALKDAA